MYLLLFVVYVAAEIAVLAWLGSTVGALATVLIFLAVNVAGYLVLGAQGRRALRGLGKLRSGPLPPTGSPDKMLTDGALIGAGAGLVLLPGLITTVLGIVLLLPSRALLRPVVRAVAARTARTHAATWRGQRLVVVDGQVVENTVVGAAPHLPGGPGRGPAGTTRPDVVDGEILEGEIVETPRQPRRP